MNCAALPESIVESELFGHARGAFTGADTARLGKFRMADGASLFLDEIGELPLHMQPKLLRVLQDGEIQCLGSDRPQHVDVRLFTATNRDLEAEVRAGRFRADLLHRLDVCRLRVPPLREHRQDIPQLAGHFADRGRTRLGTGPVRLSPEAQDALTVGDWSGNVRELENVIARGILRAAARVDSGETVLIESHDLDDRAPARAAASPSTETAADPALPFREAVNEYQRRLIRAAVRRSDGNWSAAARELGLERANLHHLAKRLGLKS